MPPGWDFLLHSGTGSGMDASKTIKISFAHVNNLQKKKKNNKSQLAYEKWLVIHAG